MYNSQFNNNVPNSDQHFNNLQFNYPTYQITNQPYLISSDNSNIGQYNVINSNSDLNNNLNSNLNSNLNNNLYYQHNYLNESLVNYSQFNNIPQSPNSYPQSFNNIPQSFNNISQSSNNFITDNYTSNHDFSPNSNYPTYYSQNSNSSTQSSDREQYSENERSDDLDPDLFFAGLVDDMNNYCPNDLVKKSSSNDLIDYITRDNNDFENESIVYLLDDNQNSKDNSSIPENKTNQQENIQINQLISDQCKDNNDSITNNQNQLTKKEDLDELHTKHQLNDIVLRDDQITQPIAKKTIRLNEEIKQPIAKKTIRLNEPRYRDDLDPLLVNLEESTPLDDSNLSISTITDVDKKEESKTPFKDHSANLIESNSSEKSDKSMIIKRKSSSIRSSIESDYEDELNIKKPKSSSIKFSIESDYEDELNTKEPKLSIESSIESQNKFKSEDELEFNIENQVYDLLKLKIGRFDLDVKAKVSINKQKQNLFLPRCIGKLLVFFDRQRLIYDFYASDVETDEEGMENKIYKRFRMMIPFNLVEAINFVNEDCSLKILLNSRPFLFLYDEESETFDFKDSYSNNAMPLFTDYCYHGVHFLKLESIKQLNNLKRNLLNFSTYKFVEINSKYKEMKIKLFKMKFNKQIGPLSVYVNELKKLNWIDVLNNDFDKKEKKVKPINKVNSSSNIDVLSALTAFDFHNIETPSLSSLSELRSHSEELVFNQENKTLKFPKKKEKAKSKKSPNDKNNLKSSDGKDSFVIDRSHPNSDSENVVREISERTRNRMEILERKKKIREQSKQQYQIIQQQNQLNQQKNQLNQQKNQINQQQNQINQERKTRERLSVKIKKNKIKKALEELEEAKLSAGKFSNHQANQPSQVNQRKDSNLDQQQKDQIINQQRQQIKQIVNQQPEQVDQILDQQHQKDQQRDEFTVLNEQSIESMEVNEIDYHESIELNNQKIVKPIDLSETTNKQVDHQIIELDNEQFYLSSDEEESRLVIDEDYEDPIE